MFVKKCASEVGKVRKKGRPGNKTPGTDLGQCMGKKVRSNLPELPNITFMVVICRMSNGRNEQTSSMQLQASYPDVRHWEEMIDFIEKNCRPIEPYFLTVLYKWNLTQDKLDKEYMGLYTPGQMLNDSLYGQISYNSSLTNAFKLQLGHNVQLFLLEMKAATGKNIAEHAIRPAKAIPPSLVTVCYAPLQISILKLRRYPMKMKEWWIRRY